MDVFAGQIILTAFSFAPQGFAQCNGQLLPVNQNRVLYSLIGMSFGGNGSTLFALPDMRGRTALGQNFDTARGSPIKVGTAGGVESVPLTIAQIPNHNHAVCATTTVATTSAGGGMGFATTQTDDGFPLYAATATGAVPLSQETIAPTGSGQPHPNMQPFQVINYCIALTGLYPTRQ